MHRSEQPCFIVRAALALAFGIGTYLAGSCAARAACPDVDAKLAVAQTALREAEPARDATEADLMRRLNQVADAFAAERDAETIRTTTAGGCRDIQQVYEVMLTHAWANLVLAYLKPSFDFYITDAGCAALSRIETRELVGSANETMVRSLILWSPVQPHYTIVRDHVAAMIPHAAAYVHVDLPGPDDAEDFERRASYGLDVARSRESTDCGAALSGHDIPKAIADRIFKG